AADSYHQLAVRTFRIETSGLRSRLVAKLRCKALVCLMKANGQLHLPLVRDDRTYRLGGGRGGEGRMAPDAFQVLSDVIRTGEVVLPVSVTRGLQDFNAV